MALCALVCLHDSYNQSRTDAAGIPLSAPCVVLPMFTVTLQMHFHISVYGTVCWCISTPRVPHSCCKNGFLELTTSVYVTVRCISQWTALCVLGVFTSVLLIMHSRCPTVPLPTLCILYYQCLMAPFRVIESHRITTLSLPSFKVY